MNMIDKLDELMKEKELTKADVAKGAGIPYTTFDGVFKKGYDNMKLSTLIKLSDFFGVTIDYLADDEITDRNYGRKISLDITSREHKLLTNFKKLPESVKSTIEELSEIEAKKVND